MATPQQVTELITLLQTQNQQMQTLIDQRQPNQTNNNRTKKPDRPVINAGMDDREWAVYLDSWSLYKNMTGITDPNTLRMELRAACSTDLNRMLFEFVGADALNTCTEEEMLAHIKSVAVKQTHPEVHQTSFNLMKQDQGEPITRFVSRLKAKAFLCKFEIQCSDHDPPRSISYAEHMVAQRLVAGLANVDHQRKILSEAATLTTLDAKIKRLQILETTEESASVLHGGPSAIPAPAPAEVAATRSQYRRDRTNGGDDKPEEIPLCKGCGDPYHEGGRKNCHAINKKCLSCKMRGHLAKVCLKSKSKSTPIHDDNSNVGPGQQPACEQVRNQYEPIASESAVSFSFGAAQDFRHSKKKNERP